MWDVKHAALKPLTPILVCKAGDEGDLGDKQIRCTPLVQCGALRPTLMPPHQRQHPVGLEGVHLDLGPVPQGLAWRVNPLPECAKVGGDPVVPPSPLQLKKNVFAQGKYVVLV